MTVDQLLLVVQEAARNLIQRTTRPYPVALVVPLPGSTKVTSLDGFPDDDDERTDVMSVFAARHLIPDNAACFGMVAEATGADGQDVLVVVYGARRRGSFVTAAMIEQDGLGEFAEPEPLEPTAMPFIQPLQHAVDMAEPASDPGGGLPIIGA